MKIYVVGTEKNPLLRFLTPRDDSFEYPKYMLFDTVNGPVPNHFYFKAYSK